MSRYRVLSVMTVFIALLICPASLRAGAIIVDHRCVDITRIPESAITRAKSTLHIAYGHTSHGSQVTDGMTGLVAFANGGGKGLSLPENIFAWSHNDQTPDKLHLYEGDEYGSGDLDHDCGYWPGWRNETIAYLGDPNQTTGRGKTHPDCNVIIWSWCGQVDDKYKAGTLQSEYLDPMNQLESDYFGVTFVYMTGHVDHFDDAANKAANQMVRDYCRANGKVLYDFADIECYDPNGTFYEFPHDNCDYYASAESTTPLGNWATAWQGSHTVGVDWYSCGSAHSEPLNANQKAFAAWWLWARIAGWNGPVSLPPIIHLLTGD